MTADPAARIAALFAQALRLHQSSQLAEAETLYRQVLAADPNHSDSLHLTGVIAHQVGRNDIAVDLIGQAIALNELAPEFHNNIGEAYRALGRLDAAAWHFERSLALRPGLSRAGKQSGPCSYETRQAGRSDRSF